MMFNSNKPKLSKFLVSLMIFFILPSVMQAGEIHEASRDGQIENVKQLLILGVDVNAKDKDGRTPLFYAAFKSNIALHKLLIAKGADVNAKDVDGHTPLHEAAFKDNIEAAKLLIAKGADINAKDKDGRTPLHRSTRHDNTELAKMLIAKGADVNAKDKYGYTPLYMTTDSGYIEFTKLLITKGADVNIKDKDEWTPLHWAASEGNTELTMMLVAKGAGVNAKDKNGLTPLHHAAGKGNAGVVKFLIDLRVDVNAKDKNGWTPLYFATLRDNIEVAKLLITRGADPTIKIQETGYTSLFLAEEKGLMDLAELMRKHSGVLKQTELNDAVYIINQKASTTSGSKVIKAKKIAIHISRMIKPQPAIPVDAIQIMAKGKEALKLAQQKSNFEEVQSLYLSATNIAPWWPYAYYNLALIQEKLGWYSDAVEHYKLYIHADPNATDLYLVQKKIYDLEYLIEQEKKNK